MTNHSRALIGIITVLSAAAALSATSTHEPANAAAQSEAAAKAVMPRYDAQGQLLLPQDWRRWVFAGSSLGLSYAQGGPATAGREMFHETLLEPTAYQHFVDTGTFREGTMLVLALHGTGEGVLPARRGRFAAAATVDAHAAPVQQTPPSASLALKGLDPILLVAGREEMGKPEIIAVHKGYQYQFVSEPHRATFASDPQKYSIQNDTCPVVIGAPVDPELFAVHEGKIYALGTTDCVQQFKSRPTEYVKP